MNRAADSSPGQVEGDIVVIQRNPRSGSGQRRRMLHDLIRELRHRRYRVRMFHRRSRLDAYLQEERVAPNLRCVVAAGGDGTVSSLVNRHPGVPVAVLPMGTENLIARHLKIPGSGSGLAEIIDAGQYREFDTAQAGDQQFLIMASAGIDADVVHRLHAGRTGHIRHWSYLPPIIRSLWHYHGRMIGVLDQDTGKSITGSLAVVSNFREYGLNTRLNPDADPTDGQLDVCVFQGTAKRQMVAFLVRSLFRTQTGPDVVRFRSRHVSLLTADSLVSDPASAAATPRIPLQSDGDPTGVLPVEITINPSAMRLLIQPPSAPANCP